LPGDVVKERIRYYPVNHQNSSSARRTASPPHGVFFRGRGSPDHLLAAGAQRTSTRRDPLICPTSPPHALTRGRQRGRSAVSPATHTVGGPGTTRPTPSHEGNWPSHHPHTRVVRDTRRPPHRTSGIPYGAGEGSRRDPTPGPQPSIA
jgi:hypothetical protein